MSQPVGTIRVPAPIRWVDKVRVERECWIWTGAKNAKGYGHFRYKGKVRRAHRWGYEFWVGQIPKGYELDHWYCQNPSCVSPLHLEPVTRAENLRRKFLSRTHCRNGHPYDDVRVDTDPETGWRHRYCRYCKREWKRERAKRQ